MLCWTLQHWIHYLLPKKFLLNTDHRNLIQIYKSENIDKYNQILQKHILYFQQFNCQLTDIIGDQFPLVDQLSREKVKIKLKIFKHNEKNIKDAKLSEMNNKIGKFMEEHPVTQDEMDQIIQNNHQNYIKCINKYNSNNNKKKSNLLINLNKYVFNNNNKLNNKQKQQLNKSMKWCEIMIEKGEKRINKLKKLEYKKETEEEERRVAVTQTSNIIEFQEKDGELGQSQDLIVAVAVAHGNIIKNIGKVARHIKKKKLLPKNPSKKQIKNYIKKINLITTKLNKNKNMKRIYIMTRSQKKIEEKKEKEKQKEILHLEDDEIEMEEEMKDDWDYRDDQITLLHDIYQTIWGCRDDLIKILDPVLFLEQQKQDDHCQTIRKLLTDYENFIKFDDYNQLKEHRPALAKAFDDKLIRINEKSGLLEYKKQDEESDEIRYLILVPDGLIWKLIDYAHWNQFNGHIGEEQTILWCEDRFIWEDMKNDIRYYIKACDTCQLGKGGVRNVGFLRPLESEAPREWIIVDYAGPFHGGLYILVIIDHFTGYVILVPVYNTGAEDAMYSILNEWVVLFGWYKYISSDRGSAFIKELNKRIHNLFGIKDILAEPRNHRSIGKVERMIGIIKNILQKWNIELSDFMVKNNNRMEAIEAIKGSLKTIQAGLNNRVSRVHGLSANELMFGEKLTEWPDIKLFKQDLNKLKKELNLKQSDCEFVDNLKRKLKLYKEIAIKNREKYLLVMKDQFNKKRKESKLKKGDLVVYYIGDRNQTLRKLRAKWSGPWKVKRIIYENSKITIMDPEDEKVTADVHVGRVKPYRQREFYTWNQHEKKLNKRELKEEIELDLLEENNLVF